MCKIIKRKIILKLSYPNKKVVYIPKQINNILTFKIKEKPVLSDDDIHAMFGAFLSLVKKNTLLRYELMYKNKIKYYIDRLNDVMIENRKKDNQIKLLCKLCGIDDKQVNEDCIQTKLDKANMCK